MRRGNLSACPQIFLNSLPGQADIRVFLFPEGPESGILLFLMLFQEIADSVRTRALYLQTPYPTPKGPS